MKFLVLALCVCAASAASFSQFPGYQPVANAAAQVFTAPVETTYAAAKVVAQAPLVAAKTIYNAAKDSEATILRSESEVLPDSYNFFFETNNGIAAQASGVPKNIGNDKVVLAVQGSYKYIDVNGREVVVTYVSDENGYQPQSDVLPVGPAIPEAILRSLEYIRANYKPEKNF